VNLNVNDSSRSSNNFPKIPDKNETGKTKLSTMTNEIILEMTMEQSFHQTKNSFFPQNAEIVGEELDADVLDDEDYKAFKKNLEKEDDSKETSEIVED
jgi:hypothetical protein